MHEYAYTYIHKYIASKNQSKILLKINRKMVQNQSKIVLKINRKQLLRHITAIVFFLQNQVSIED